MKNNILKKGLFFFFLFLLFFSSLFLLFGPGKQERLFEEVTTNIFKNEMTANTLNMHYTLAFPENYGIYQYQPQLPVYTSSSQNTSAACIENYLSSLKKISSGFLRKESSYTFQLLESYLENQLLLNSFPYYEEPLSPSSGMQSQYPILMAEYQFRTKRDVADYLLLLSQTPAYFEGLLEYEKEKAEAGLFMTDASLEDIYKQCSEIMSPLELKEGKHFLQITFSERIASLKEQGILSDDEVHTYRTLHQRVLQEKVLPAYQSLASGLLSLKGKGVNSDGLYYFPDGRSYYTCLLRQSTGSYKSIEEIKKLLQLQLEQEYHAIHTLASQNPNVVENIEAALDPILFPYEDADTMLADLMQQINTQFPPLPQDKTSQLHVAIKDVSSCLENYSSPAFYLTPPLDDTNNHAIYINQKYAPTGLELYTTLAHEGFPGHLYQAVYSQLSLNEAESNPVRQILWYGGYLEGWALYVEFISYDYAAQLMNSHGHSDSAIAFEIEKHNRSLQLCLYSLLDIAIHHDGATYPQIEEVLNSFGLTDEAVCQAIYQYLVTEPANYLKYYLGYLEILELKQEAKVLWEDTFSDYRFHEFYLSVGPSDFPRLHKALKNYE